MAKVGIVMGSDSDMPVMKKAAEILEQLGVDFEMDHHFRPQRAGMYFLNTRRARRAKGSR